MLRLLNSTIASMPLLEDKLDIIRKRLAKLKEFLGILGPMAMKAPLGQRAINGETSYSAHEKQDGQERKPRTLNCPGL